MPIEKKLEVISLYLRYAVDNVAIDEFIQTHSLKKACDVIRKEAQEFIAAHNIKFTNNIYFMLHKKDSFNACNSVNDLKNLTKEVWDKILQSFNAKSIYEQKLTLKESEEGEKPLVKILYNFCTNIGVFNEEDCSKLPKPYDAYPEQIKNNLQKLMDLHGLDYRSKVFGGSYHKHTYGSSLVYSAASIPCSKLRKKALKKANEICKLIPEIDIYHTYPELHGNSVLMTMISNGASLQPIDVIEAFSDTAPFAADLQGKNPLHLLILKAHQVDNHETESEVNWQHEDQRPIFSALLQHSSAHTHINDQDVHGNSALHLACIRHDSFYVDALLKAGANPLLKNSNGKTALDLYRLSLKERKNILYQAYDIEGKHNEYMKATGYHLTGLGATMNEDILTSYDEDIAQKLGTDVNNKTEESQVTKTEPVKQNTPEITKTTEEEGGKALSRNNAPHSNNFIICSAGLGGISLTGLVISTTFYCLNKNNDKNIRILTITGIIISIGAIIAVVITAIKIYYGINYITDNSKLECDSTVGTIIGNPVTDNVGDSLQIG